MQNQIICCEFQTINWNVIEKCFYTCVVQDKLIHPNVDLKLIGCHWHGKCDKNVNFLNFLNCNITKIPKNLSKTFPNLKGIQIFNSNLKNIRREDLKEYSYCKALFFAENKIEFLPGDLFKDMQHLEEISFVNNKIHVIEPELLDGLNKLIYINLSGNMSINNMFDAIQPENATLDELKKEIKDNFSSSAYVKEIRQELNDLKTKHEELKSKNHVEMMNEIKNIISNEKFKDCTVKLRDEKFKANKFLLAARSPVLAEMIASNIDAEIFNLFNVSAEIFREILNFINTDELPTDDNIDFVQLFITVHELKIEKLKTFAIQKLIAKLNADNAFEMLDLSNEYEIKELRQKSFKEIKKMFGDGKLDENLATQKEKLAKLLKLKKEKDEIEAKIKDFIINQ